MRLKIFTGGSGKRCGPLPGTSGTRPGAVIIGGHINALTTVRALASKGVESTVISTTRADMAPWSRYTKETIYLREFHAHPEQLLALLKSHIDDWKGKVLMPTNDHALEILALNREELTPHFRVAAPKLSTTRKIIDKNLLYNLARDFGIPVARDFGSANHNILHNNDLTFPLLVKPHQGYQFQALFGKKVSVVRNLQELESQVKLLEKYSLKARIMELIPGPDTNCYNFTCYRDKKGNILGAFRIRKMRKSPPGFGVGRVAYPTEENGFEETARRLLDGLDWHGPASLEFKRKPRDGKFALLDFNGRCFLMAGVALLAGINYAYLTWLEAVGEKLKDPQPTEWNGCWIHLLDDLYYSLLRRDLERLTLHEFLAPYKKSRRFAVASYRDPLPFLAQAVRGSSKLLAGRWPDT